MRTAASRSRRQVGHRIDVLAAPVRGQVGLVPHLVGGDPAPVALGHRADERAPVGDLLGRGRAGRLLGTRFGVRPGGARRPARRSTAGRGPGSRATIASQAAQSYSPRCGSISDQAKRCRTQPKPPSAMWARTRVQFRRFRGGVLAQVDVDAHLVQVGQRIVQGHAPPARPRSALAARTRKPAQSRPAPPEQRRLNQQPGRLAPSFPCRPSVVIQSSTLPRHSYSAQSTCVHCPSPVTCCASPAGHVEQIEVAQIEDHQLASIGRPAVGKGARHAGLVLAGKDRALVAAIAVHHHQRVAALVRVGGGVGAGVGDLALALSPERAGDQRGVLHIPTVRVRRARTVLSRSSAQISKRRLSSAGRPGSSPCRCRPQRGCRATRSAWAARPDRPARCPVGPGGGRWPGERRARCGPRSSPVGRGGRRRFSCRPATRHSASPTNCRPPRSVWRAGGGACSSPDVSRSTVHRSLLARQPGGPLFSPVL